MGVRLTSQRLKALQSVPCPMSHHVKPVPDGYHTVTPVLIVDHGMGALEFYAKALGAKERMRSLGPNGKLAHAEIQVGDSIIMLAEEDASMGSRSPKALGGVPGGIWLYVSDVDQVHRQAVASGATSMMAPEDMFWGDRHARIRDPFGHEWSIASHREDVSGEELEKRAREFYAKMGSAGGRPADP
jgi:PhnB protein